MLIIDTIAYLFLLPALTIACYLAWTAIVPVVTETAPHWTVAVEAPGATVIPLWTAELWGALYGADRPRSTVARTVPGTVATRETPALARVRVSTWTRAIPTVPTVRQSDHCEHRLEHAPRFWRGQARDFSELCRPWSLPSPRPSIGWARDWDRLIGTEHSYVTALWRANLLSDSEAHDMFEAIGAA